MEDYRTYHATGREKIGLLVKGMLLTTAIAWLFYKSIWVVLLAAPFALFYVKAQEKKRAEERKWEFNQQFKQGILALSAALNAGYSVENAFGEATKDLALMYAEDADIIKEFSGITRQLAMNQTVEECLVDLGERTGIEDVENFAEIFQTAKRTGGDIMDIIQKTGSNIEERLEIQREMNTLIAQKKLEGKIMSVVPLGMILYMWITSPGFLDVLYHNLYGCCFMSVALVLYLVSYGWMQKIVDIRL